jgi:hypothetical protein
MQTATRCSVFRTYEMKLQIFANDSCPTFAIIHHFVHAPLTRDRCNGICLQLFQRRAVFKIVSLMFGGHAFVY